VLLSKWKPAPCGIRPALVTLAGVPLTQALVSNSFPRACITRTLKLNDLTRYYRGAVWRVRVGLLLRQLPRHCCVHRCEAQAGCVDASLPLSVTSAEVNLCWVSFPAIGAHSGCALVVALGAVVPRRRRAAGL